MTMKGDYKNSLMAITTGSAKTALIDEIFADYDSALSVAKNQLPSYNSLRLKLVLNFSGFYYEYIRRGDAWYFVKQIYDKTIAEIDDVIEDSYSYNKFTAYMLLLRDRMIRWEPAYAH